MLSWNDIVVDFQNNWILYLSMPFIASGIGFVTKIVAINMMFHPIEFWGIKPYFGWQGIVPRKANRMTEIAVDMLTSKLLTTEEIFSRLDPDRVAAEIEKPMVAAIEEITRDIAAAYSPGLWEAAPETLKKLMVKRIQGDSPAVVSKFMAEVKANINEVFDLKAAMVASLMKDKTLLNRIFRDVGRAEFRFIRNSGLYFGFALGIVQAITWAGTHSVWVMPIFGGLTGWLTDWLALRMVFEPKEPKRFFGVFVWQGMFIKRRKQVAAEYGRLIAKEILTPENVINGILHGPLSDRLADLVQKHVQNMVDAQSGIAKPFVVFTVGSKKYQEMKRTIAQRIVERMPETLKHVEKYATDAMDIERTLSTKMQDLTAEQFEGLLRPAFQQDEWILITVGAVLGFMVGELQVFLMLHH
ncbi:DUF445 family protein [Stenotrophobium rhamnosiphilum]|uniref:DUF445 domain-containing protein n=1 Tax=Stenotrophobium rhamnosiphilum TaxID=2029166 RepID=A0A2T5MK49_9GAMM|nr:DUF445 family protein [Stenotrophobium rhamnosiphilum]PTU32953.1 DUF445 domain-containing protein [Stenotrophobium rhamnosiphilum]